jgi:hypothetical protein
MIPHTCIVILQYIPQETHGDQENGPRDIQKPLTHVSTTSTYICQHSIPHTLPSPPIPLKFNKQSSHTLDFSSLQQSVSKIKSRSINEETIEHFQALLEDETWDTICKSICTNEMYSSFQDFLRYYEASFPVFYTKYGPNHNNWVTKGIKISCTKKRGLYSLYRNNEDNIQVKNHYKNTATY